MTATSTVVRTAAPVVEVPTIQLRATYHHKDSALITISVQMDRSSLMTGTTVATHTSDTLHGAAGTTMTSSNQKQCAASAKAVPGQMIQIGSPTIQIGLTTVSENDQSL